MFALIKSFGISSHLTYIVKTNFSTNFLARYIRHLNLNKLNSFSSNKGPEVDKFITTVAKQLLFQRDKT